MPTDPVTASERLDAIAELYRRATGKWAPFKDAPAELRVDNHTDEARVAYDEWIATHGFRRVLERVVELQRALDAAVQALEDDDNAD